MLLIRWWWHLPSRCSKMLHWYAGTWRPATGVVMPSWRPDSMEFWIRKSLELSFAVILWYWFVNSANFVVYLKYFTNIRQKTRDYLLYTRFWVGRIAGWEGDGAPGAGAHKCLPPNLPPNQSSSAKTSVGNSIFWGSFGVTSFFGVWRCEASDVPAINRGQGHRTTTSKYRLLVQGKAAGIQLRISPLRLRLVVNFKEHDRENDGNAAGRIICNCLRASTTWGTALMAREREREMLAGKVKPKMNFCQGRPLLGWWLDLICVVMSENLMQSPRSPMSSLKWKNHG